MEETTMTQVSEKAPSSPVNKWLKGCGIGCLGMIIILVILGFIAYKWGMSQLNKWTAEFESRGFVQVKGQMIDVKEPVTKPTLYVGQGVTLRKGSDTEVAIIAQMGELHGRFKGKVYFRGQMLIIPKDAELDKGLDVKAQIIQNLGKVTGGITGSYQSIQDQEPKATTTAPKTK